MYFEKMYFEKTYFENIYFKKIYFEKIYFEKIYFKKIYLEKIYLEKIYFEKMATNLCSSPRNCCLEFIKDFFLYLVNLLLRHCLKARKFNFNLHLIIENSLP